MAKIDFTLNPHQIQPAHIVITSPYFRTEERNFGNKSHGAYNPLGEASIQQIVSMRERGMILEDIGTAIGISRQRAKYYYEKGKA